MTGPLSRADLERIREYPYDLDLEGNTVRDLATTALWLMDRLEEAEGAAKSHCDKHMGDLLTAEARVKELEQRNIEAVQAYYTAEARIKELEEGLREVLRGIPYLGLSSQENWECKHGFMLDECQNADCPELLAQKAIDSARALLTERNDFGKGGTPDV